MIGLFVYTLLPLGFFLVAMLLSGSDMLMSGASKLLGVPIGVNAFRISLAVVSTALSSIMTVLFYAQLSRYESRLSDEITVFAEASGMRGRQQLKAGFAQRNFYICVLGFLLWGMAWRLKALYDSRKLVVARAARPRASGTRFIYLIVSLVAFIVADIPLCRLNYNLNLSTFVTPRKHALMNSFAVPCANVYKARATGECAKFCDDVAALSEERRQTILWARRWHPLGGIAAQIFDAGRGVEQDEGRIGQLFQKRPCDQVLRSVDKSNVLVNILCMVAAVIGVMGGFSALATVFDVGVPDNAHED